MTRNTQSKSIDDHGALAPLDIADALDLLAAVMSRDIVVPPVSRSDIGYDTNCYAFDGEPRGVVGQALSLANVGVDRLESMGDQPLRDLYRDGRLPIPITLGALIVLDAAQRSQDRGHRWDDVLEDATAAAARFLDLVSVLPDVARSRYCRGTRRVIGSNTGQVPVPSIRSQVTRAESPRTRSAAVHAPAPHEAGPRFHWVIPPEPQESP